MISNFPLYPRVSQQRFKAWNEEMFHKYNNERVYYHPNPLIRFVEGRRVETILKFLGPIRPTTYILAAGCGEGYIESQIRSGKILMVDLSTEAIHRIKQSFSKIPNRYFKVASLEKLTVKNQVIDLIECSEVIEHVYDPKRMLTEFYRVLKPQGKLVVSFPNEPLINFIKRFFIHLGVFKLFFPDIPEDMTEEWHLRSMDLNRFQEMIGLSWVLEEVHGIPYDWFPIRYVVRCSKK